MSAIYAVYMCPVVAEEKEEGSRLGGTHGSFGLVDGVCIGVFGGNCTAGESLANQRALQCIGSVQCRSKSTSLCRASLPSIASGITDRCIRLPFVRQLLQARKVFVVLREGGHSQGRWSGKGVEVRMAVVLEVKVNVVDGGKIRWRRCLSKRQRQRQR